MTEAFLQYIWQYQQFDKTKLSSHDNRSIEIIKIGQKNHDAGPDFLQARIVIDSIEWVGHIEIHVNSTDWLLHFHQNDPSYYNVILHVVWKHTGDILNKEGTAIPTLELEPIANKNSLLAYQTLLQNPTAIPCEHHFKDCSSISKISMLEQALAHRLEKKGTEIKRTLNATLGDWQETTYRTWAKNMGFKLNADAFLRLSEVLPLKILQKHAHKLLHMEALVFGQAGFLEDENDDDYHKSLKNEYLFLAKKYELHQNRMARWEWKFLRTRPANFPTIRLSQFSAILHHTSHLWAIFVEHSTITEIETILKQTPSDYWQTHYDFGKVTKIKLKGMGKTAIENVIINTAVQLLASYASVTNNHTYFEKAISLLEQLPAERNSITEKWENLDMKINSSFDSQALIEQHNEFCLKKRCLSCPIGISILKQN
jgi:Protein of unknown function (DUF2851)